MSKLPDYASKSEMSILVMMGTVSQLMANAGKYYQDKDRQDWARKLKCSATYIHNVSDARYEMLDREQKVAYNRRYKKMNMYVSCTDTERYDPDTQDDIKVDIATADLYQLAEGMIEGQCKGCQKIGSEIADCKYKNVMLRLCIPISENNSECPFSDGNQNINSAVDAEYKILKSKI